MKTIEDYKAMVKELKALGKELVRQEWEKDELADWVEELDCMDIHLDCCLAELEECSK